MSKPINPEIDKDLNANIQSRKLESVAQFAIFVEKLFLKEWLQTNFFSMTKRRKIFLQKFVYEVAT